jgi:hypothetical protein
MAVAATMFFDLKSLPDDTSSHTRPAEFYVKHGEVTLSQNVPMVILCDSVTRAWIEPLRARLSSCPTVYIEKPLYEYDHYRLNYDIVKANRVGKIEDKDTRATISYFLTMIMKLHAIKIAHGVFPSATHYFWLDFGCSHIADKASEFLPKILVDPNPKVSCAYIHYRSTEELKCMEQFLRRMNPCGIAATIFSVERDYVYLFYTRAMSLFYEFMARGVGYTDEGILTYMYDRFPEMFHLYYGDYYSVVCNYKYVCRDYPSIKHYYINNCLRHKKLGNVKDCARVILESVESGHLSLPEAELTILRSY